ncbi:MAG TPA: hypothetical protein VHT71_13020 [Methylomirabilota bacterium]|jgi:hypothetical protein|nr:hypothetical protein [Methylomirabilota bacterium]
MAGNKLNEHDNKDAQESGRPVQLDKEPKQGDRSGQQQGTPPERRPDTERPLGTPHQDRPQPQNR